MQISFIPMRRDDRPELSVTGDVLTINGEEFDFSGVPDGATLPRDAVVCGWLASDVTRIGGVLHLTLILPHGPLPDVPQETLRPVPVSVSAGPVPLPPYANGEENT